MRLPRLVLTPGDPTGIGPEITAKLCSDPKWLQKAHVCIAGDRKTLIDAFQRWGDPTLLESGSIKQPLTPGKYTLVDAHVANGFKKDVAPESTAIAFAALSCLEGAFDAMVTGPISKERLNALGFPYPGHTQFLGALTGSSEAIMTFTAKNLRVSLLTNHIPLSQVSEAVTEQALLRTIEVCNKEIGRLYGLERVRIGVCGLNPHAGENGLLGQEDNAVLKPAIHKAQALGFDVRGPIPSDSIFSQAIAGQYDLVIALYHDQGLIPIKLLGRGAAVHLTLGLPIIRTSVDHGTAHDIAGKGIADPAGLISATEEALRICT